LEPFFFRMPRKEGERGIGYWHVSDLGKHTLFLMKGGGIFGSCCNIGRDLSTLIVRRNTFSTYFSVPSDREKVTSIIPAFYR